MTDTMADTWHERADGLSIDGRAVIDGERVAAASGATTADVNPATGAVHAEVAALAAVDIDRAVAAARGAFDDGRWSRLSAEDRKVRMLRLADLMQLHADELALLDSLDMGKPVREAREVDVPGAIATFRWYAEAVDKLLDEIPSTPPGSTALVTREALGVVAAITPWNYPLEIAAWKLAPALALGNSVVHKPASVSPLSALRLADLALEAGIPAGVLNVVPGPGGRVGEAIGLHHGIDALTFTGSTAVAKTLLEYSGRSNMKRLSLEAGGKSANMVFADCDDLPGAAETAARGAFYNQGEVCSANSRLLVERRVHDEFVALVAEAARAYAPGDPLDGASGSGALVSRSHADDVWAAITSARAAGSLVIGAERLEIDGSDAFIVPTVVTGLPEQHPLHSTEVFGPLLTVETFETEDEAVAKANATAYGLAASVWTSSLSRAHRVSQRLVAGTVSVNTVDALGLTTPFGGFKQSGFGRDLSLHAFDAYSALKTTWIQFG
jgi:aldehyde dehydrogenase (NAD+)/gamma-glutamyl-gamma-aminobutyraldehyde dehydrogenase